MDFFRRDLSSAFKSIGSNERIGGRRAGDRRSSLVLDDGAGGCGVGRIELAELVKD